MADETADQTGGDGQGGEVNQESDENNSYRVEVGITRTGVATVNAESEEVAREEAQKQMAVGLVSTEIAEIFTNNVREGSDDE